MTSAASTLKLLFANRVPLPSHTLPLSTLSAAVESGEKLGFAVFELIMQLIKYALPSCTTWMPPAPCASKANGQEHQVQTAGAHLMHISLRQGGGSVYLLINFLTVFNLVLATKSSNFPTYYTRQAKSR